MYGANEMKTGNVKSTITVLSKHWNVRVWKLICAML